MLVGGGFVHARLGGGGGIERSGRHSGGEAWADISSSSSVRYFQGGRVALFLSFFVDWVSWPTGGRRGGMYAPGRACNAYAPYLSRGWWNSLTLLNS